MTEAPGPKDKLDAATTVAVNGPEDEILDKHAIDWRQAEMAYGGCGRGSLRRYRPGPGLLPAYEPTGLVEPGCSESGTPGSEGNCR
jgi:hypothetical protein